MKITQAPNIDKKKHLERLLTEGLVTIFVDSQRSDVLVPNQHKYNPQLILNLSYKFYIPDFKIVEDHVEGTLKFGSIPFFCHIPFDGIYGMVSQGLSETVVFPESIPGELLTKAHLPPDYEEAKENVNDQIKKETKPAFSVIENQPPPPPAPSKPKKGHLKIVK